MGALLTKIERADLRSERADFRPKRSERAVFRPERADFRSEKAWGRQMEGQMDGQTKVPLCSTGLHPLWGHCPASSHYNSQSCKAGQRVSLTTYCDLLVPEGH